MIKHVECFFIMLLKFLVYRLLRDYVHLDGINSKWYIFIQHQRHYMLFIIVYFSPDASVVHAIKSLSNLHCLAELSTFGKVFGR